MDGNLEAALRRASAWASRGMPRSGAELLVGTNGQLRFRHEAGDLCACLPTGEEIHVALSTTNKRVTITRIAGDCTITASADIPTHLVEHAR